MIIAFDHCSLQEGGFPAAIGPHQAIAGATAQEHQLATGVEMLHVTHLGVLGNPVVSTEKDRCLTNGAT